MESALPLVFICSGAQEKEEKLANRLATSMEKSGLAQRGDIKKLDTYNRNRPWVFLNECKSSCIKLVALEYPGSHVIDIRNLEGSIEELIARYIQPVLAPAPVGI